MEIIWRAQKVFIIGLNASMALAYLLHFRLVRVKKDSPLDLSNRRNLAP